MSTAVAAFLSLLVLVWFYLERIGKTEPRDLAKKRVRHCCSASLFICNLLTFLFSLCAAVLGTTIERELNDLWFGASSDIGLVTMWISALAAFSCVFWELCRSLKRALRETQNDCPVASPPPVENANKVDGDIQVYDSKVGGGIQAYNVELYPPQAQDFGLPPPTRRHENECVSHAPPMQVQMQLVQPAAVQPPMLPHTSVPPVYQPQAPILFPPPPLAMPQMQPAHTTGSCGLASIEVTILSSSEQAHFERQQRYERQEMMYAV
jgi:hypothetical protein